MTDADSLSAEDLAAVSRVMTEAGATVAGPLAATLITGGRSNLTFRLDDGQSAWVLRTPPRVGRTPSAHDVAREHRVTAALGVTDVPVARAVALCEDESPIGGPFAVSEFVAGRTIQTRESLDQVDDVSLCAVVEELVATLAALHRVDHVAVGLERFGRPDGYAERQLRRWSAQWELVGPAQLRGLAGELSAGLATQVPEQLSTSVVHGDYRIDNTILTGLDGQDAEPRIAAVVDWELSTIGDPVADVAMMCAYRDPAFDLIVGSAAAWSSTRLPDSAALAALYERAGGAWLSSWEFHLALAYFKVAVIAAGIDHRRLAGAAGGAGFDTAGDAVEPYLALGLDALRVG